MYESVMDITMVVIMLVGIGDGCRAEESGKKVPDGNEKRRADRAVVWRDVGGWRAVWVAAACGGDFALLGRGYVLEFRKRKWYDGIK